MDAIEQEIQAKGLVPHQQRVVDEHHELLERLGKLVSFFQGPIFPTLSEAERARLRSQARFMDGYAAVLGERIEAFEAESTKRCEYTWADVDMYDLPSETVNRGDRLKFSARMRDGRVFEGVVELQRADDDAKALLVAECNKQAGLA